MADYPAYRNFKNISSMDMVIALRPRFPSVTKQIIAIVNNPARYGCCLTPEAEELIVDKFGEGPGLEHPLRKKLRNMFRKEEHRKKGKRVTYWMAPDLYFELFKLKKKYGTFQAVLEHALVEFVKRERPTIGTEYPWVFIDEEARLS